MVQEKCGPNTKWAQIVADPVEHSGGHLRNFNPPLRRQFHRREQRLHPSHPKSLLASSSRRLEMDREELKLTGDEDSALMKTVKGATTGLAAGTMWGTIIATWYDVPRVERHVALPGLIRTLKMCGSYGVTFAAVGGLYIGVRELVQKQRMKRDFINGAVGGFVAGATVYGYKARSIKYAITAGSCLAFTSAVLDIGGNTTRVDNGKEYYPYTTEKRSAH